MRRIRRLRLIAISAVCTAAASLIVAYGAAPGKDHGGDRDKDKPPPAYNPYPPGILPSDLDSEIERVRREIRFIEEEAIGQWRALRASDADRSTANSSEHWTAGKRITRQAHELRREHVAHSRIRACGFCHMPYAGFSGPIPSVNLTMIAYPGSVQFRAGKRTAQRYTYSPNFPVLKYNATSSGLFFGGNFWDSRATGYLLGSPDAEQAQHPPVDTQEHGFP